MREDYLLHEINHNMFHFQIKLLRMIYVFTTQRKKLYKREPSENEEKEEKEIKRNSSTHFSSPFTRCRSDFKLFSSFFFFKHIVNLIVYDNKVYRFVCKNRILLHTHII